MGDVDPESTAAERLLQKLGNGAVVLGSVPKLKSKLNSSFSPNVNNAGLQAGNLLERSLKSRWRWWTT